MKAFEEWWDDYKAEGIWDYEEYFEGGWRAALKWVLKTRDENYKKGIEDIYRLIDEELSE